MYIGDSAAKSVMVLMQKIDFRLRNIMNNTGRKTFKSIIATHYIFFSSWNAPSEPNTLILAIS